MATLAESDQDFSRLPDLPADVFTAPLKKPAHVGDDWLDISLNRINHKGTKMDREVEDWNKLGDVPQVVSNLKKIHASGTGMIGMKLIGNGEFKDFKTRDESIRFVTSLDCVDSYTIGLLSAEQVDENISLLNKHLNA